MYSSVLLFLSGSDLMVIMFVALLLFGGDKLPELARGLGKGIRDFKDASEGVKREINNQINSYEEKKAEAAAANAAPSAPVTPLIEEHATPDQPVIEEVHHDNTTLVAETHGSVPNTMTYVENHGTASNEKNAADDHINTEPVKTTHE